MANVIYVYAVPKDGDAEEELMEAAAPKGTERSEDCMNLSPGLSGIMAESLDFEEKKFVWKAGRMALIIQGGWPSPCLTHSCFIFRSGGSQLAGK